MISPGPRLGQSTPTISLPNNVLCSHVDHKDCMYGVVLTDTEPCYVQSLARREHPRVNYCLGCPPTKIPVAQSD